MDSIKEATPYEGDLEDLQGNVRELYQKIHQTIKNEMSDAIRQESSKKEHSLPETKLGPKTVERKKSVSAKNVISPLAARGVEIKRNLANRRQASSVPQKEIDVDKELESWKKVEGDVE